MGFVQTFFKIKDKQTNKNFSCGYLCVTSTWYYLDRISQQSRWRREGLCGLFMLMSSSFSTWSHKASADEWLNVQKNHHPFSACDSSAVEKKADILVLIKPGWGIFHFTIHIDNRRLY